MKVDKQKRQSEKSVLSKQSKGLAGGKRKGTGSHNPSKPGRKQSSITRKTLPRLFSQASCAHDSQANHTRNNNSDVLDISDDSVSEGNIEADPSGLNHDAPLSDPISEFSPLRESSKVGDDRGPKSSIDDVNRITETSRERSRSPPPSRGGLSGLAPRSQLLADTSKESAQAEREVVPAAANCADSREQSYEHQPWQIWNYLLV